MNSAALREADALREAGRGLEDRIDGTAVLARAATHPAHDSPSDGGAAMHGWLSDDFAGLFSFDFANRFRRRLYGRCNRHWRGRGSFAGGATAEGGSEGVAAAMAGTAAFIAAPESSSGFAAGTGVTASASTGGFCADRSRHWRCACGRHAGRWLWRGRCRRNCARDLHRAHLGRRIRAR